MNPTPTLILSTRVDTRHLATLARWHHENGRSPRSMSELVKNSLHIFAEFLTINDEVDSIDTHSDAIVYLEKLGVLTKKTNPRNLAEALQEEGLNLSILKPAKDPSTHLPTRKPGDIPNLSKESVLSEFERQLKEDEERRVKEAQERAHSEMLALSTTPSNKNEGDSND